MSIHISLVHDDKVELLTDGACYDEAGVLLATKQKVTRVPGLPVAMTTRGSVEFGKRLVDVMLRVFEHAGEYDAAIAYLEAEMGKVAQKAGSVRAEMLIAGISESDGPIVHYVHTAADLEGDLEPFVVHASKRGFLGNLEFPEGHFQTAHASGGLRPNAVKMMEGQRRMKSVTLTPTGETADQYFVGGHIDCTEITATGVHTQRVHTWGDQIGQTIDPYREGENVLPLNRKQRRAAARMAAKRSA